MQVSHPSQEAPSTRLALSSRPAHPAPRRQRFPDLAWSWLRALLRGVPRCVGLQAPVMSGVGVTRQADGYHIRVPQRAVWVANHTRAADACLLSSMMGQVARLHVAEQSPTPLWWHALVRRPKWFERILFAPLFASVLTPVQVRDQVTNETAQQTRARQAANRRQLAAMGERVGRSRAQPILFPEQTVYNDGRLSISHVAGVRAFTDRGYAVVPMAFTYCFLSATGAPRTFINLGEATLLGTQSRAEMAANLQHRLLQAGTITVTGLMGAYLLLTRRAGGQPSLREAQQFAEAYVHAAGPTAAVDPELGSPPRTELVAAAYERARAHGYIDIDGSVSAKLGPWVDVSEPAYFVERDGPPPSMKEPLAYAGVRLLHRAHACNAAVTQLAIDELRRGLNSEV